MTVSALDTTEGGIWQALAAVPHELTYVDAGGVRTRCLETGDGPPLVLLHGTGGHIEAFARNFGPLGERFRVVAFDIVGHGFSQQPPDFPYDWPGMTGHLLAVLEQLGLARPVLVGEGLGAQLAQWVAMRHPDRIAGAVLACTLIVPQEDAGLLVQTDDMARFQELSRQALENPTRDVIRKRMEWLLHDPSAVTDELVSIRLEMWSADGVRHAQRRILESYVRAADDERLRVTREDARGIDVPLLVVWSQSNPLMPAEVARRFAGYPGGGCEYVELERSAMWPQYEEPDRFNHLVATFADSVGASA